MLKAPPEGFKTKEIQNYFGMGKKAFLSSEGGELFRLIRGLRKGQREVL